MTETSGLPERRDGQYGSFETDDGGLVIYDRDNRAAFVASDRPRTVVP